MSMADYSAILTVLYNNENGGANILDASNWFAGLRRFNMGPYITAVRIDFTKGGRMFCDKTVAALVFFSAP